MQFRPIAGRRHPPIVDGMNENQSRPPLTLADVRDRGTIPRWPDAGEVLGISRTLTYAAAKKGDIPIVRIGRRIVVPVPALRRLLGDSVD